MIGFVSLAPSISAESLSKTGQAAYMTVIHANGKFPKLLLAQKQRPLLKQCRTQQFGFHWTGFVVSTYITSIWSLEGDAEFKLLIAPPESRCHFKDLWWLAHSPKEIFSPWTFGLISYQTPTELWKSDLWKLIFNGCESRKSSLISCLMCSGIWHASPKH